MHNRQITKSVPSFEGTKVVGAKVCILLRTGELYGPFNSIEDARYWCVALDLNGFSTYDLLTPNGRKE